MLCFCLPFFSMGHSVNQKKRRPGQTRRKAQRIENEANESPAEVQTTRECSTKTMSVLIRISKDNLKNHPELGSRLSLLCEKIKEEIDACVYTPEPGALMIFLRLLNGQGINYEIVYDDPINITHANSNGT